METKVKKKPTIFVVEDENALRILVCTVLKRHGFQVIDAPSGLAALELWGTHKEHIDVLLTDMVMPDGMTGRELAEQLQSESPDLKVIFTTGYSTALLGKDIVLQDGINFLQKPYAPQKLLTTIRNCFGMKE